MVKRWERIFCKISNRTRIVTLTTFIHHSFGSYRHSREEKEIKIILTVKQGIKLSLFADIWYYTSAQFSSVHLLSHVQLFATPWIAARQASLSVTNSWSLLKLMSIESVMPSSHFILHCPRLLLPPIPPSIRVFSNESTLHMRWPKYWTFSFSISPSNEHLGLMSLLQDGLVGSPCSPRDS